MLDGKLALESDSFIDFHHESASQCDPETMSLMSFQSDAPEKRRFLLPSRKLLPIISFLLFVITNILPAIISCGLAPKSICMKLKFLELPPMFQWMYMIGNLLSIAACIGTIGVLYSCMRRRFSVPEYAKNMVLLNINYPLGTIGVISYLIYTAFELQVSTTQVRVNEKIFLKIHLSSILFYNAINLYLLSTLTKNKTLQKHIVDSFLYKFKKLIFAFTCVTIAISFCCDILSSKYAGSPFTEILASMCSVSAMIAVFINQAYLALYYVDVKVIEYQYQSKMNEDYFFNKKMLMHQEPILF